MPWEAGRFRLDDDGNLYGPADYLKAQGNALVDQILAGRDAMFNATAHLSPNPETAVLVRLQTDYAGWRGMKSFLARDAGRKRAWRRGARDEEGGRPRIYVADLSAYSAGKLHGAWIDATQDPDDIQADIADMLAKSPVEGAEEWAIHDYEGFRGFKLPELASPETISAVANAIEEHGAVFSAVLARKGGINYLDDALETMSDRYAGAYDSLGEWAQEMAEEGGELAACPEKYAEFIDWQAYGESFDMNGDIFTVDDGGKVHVFWNR